MPIETESNFNQFEEDDDEPIVIKRKKPVSKASAEDFLAKYE